MLHTGGCSTSQKLRIFRQYYSIVQYYYVNHTWIVPPINIHPDAIPHFTRPKLLNQSPDFQILLKIVLQTIVSVFFSAYSYCVGLRMFKTNLLHSDLRFAWRGQTNKLMDIATYRLNLARSRPRSLQAYQSYFVHLSL